MAKAKFFEKRALDSRLTSPDVTAKEKWLPPSCSTQHLCSVAPNGRDHAA